MKRLALAATLALLSGSASATLCSLGAINDQCTFATDTSGGQTLFINPPNTTNVGSGLIVPFLGTQVGGNGGIEVGVNTDQSAVNQLPLDDKRDNANTFTETIQLNQLGVVTVGGVNYFDFLLDINEPNSDPARLLSIDRLAIFGQTGATPNALIDLNSTNVASLDAVDCTTPALGCNPDLFPNLSLVYRLGALNNLLLNYSLFAGSGNGYDMQMLIPTSAFSSLASDSRIVLAVQYGALPQAGADAADGFEEWAAVIAPRTVPEPATLALLGVGLIGFGIALRRRT